MRSPSRHHDRNKWQPDLLLPASFFVLEVLEVARPSWHRGLSLRRRLNLCLGQQSPLLLPHPRPSRTLFLSLCPPCPPLQLHTAGPVLRDL